MTTLTIITRSTAQFVVDAMMVSSQFGGQSVYVYVEISNSMAADIGQNLLLYSSIARLFQIIGKGKLADAVYR